VPAIEAALQHVPEKNARSILRAILGMFVDPKLEAKVKDNIRLVAPAVWSIISEEARYEVGLKYATYSANGDVTRKAAAKVYLELVRGLSYLPPDSLSVELNEQRDNLANAHYGWNNYNNEVPHAKSLARYVPASGTVPTSVLPKYIKTLLLCRIGNANYSDGVSRGARRYYDLLLGRCQEREILEAASLLGDGELTSRLPFTVCQQNFCENITAFRTKVSNVHLARALDMILTSTTAQLPSLGSDTRYRTAVRSVVL
jgi:hypothetical protein